MIIKQELKMAIPGLVTEVLFGEMSVPRSAFGSMEVKTVEPILIFVSEVMLRHVHIQSTQSSIELMKVIKHRVPGDIIYKI